MMDSLSLSTLQDSLPAANLVNAEKDLLNSFKAAALSITTLYRSSRHTSKRAYNAGYTAACQDLLLMIQHGVSDAGPSAAPGNGGMDVGRVMDWVEARLSAIRAREEEEDEDEERERAGAGLGNGPKATSTPAPKARRRTSPPPQMTPSSHQHRSSSPTPVPFTPTVPPIIPTSSSSRSNPNANTITTPISAPRPFKARAPSSIAFPPTPVLEPLPVPVSDTVSVGQKRRHALVSMLDTGSSGTSSLAFSAPATPSGSVPGGLVRRRTRHSIRGGSALALGPSAVQNQAQAPGRTNGEGTGADIMDVEEDSGRERKRVARR